MGLEDSRGSGRLTASHGSKDRDGAREGSRDLVQSVKLSKHEDLIRSIPGTHVC